MRIPSKQRGRNKTYFRQNMTEKTQFLLWAHIDKAQISRKSRKKRKILRKIRIYISI